MTENLIKETYKALDKITTEEKKIEYLKEIEDGKKLKTDMAKLNVCEKDDFLEWVKWEIVDTEIFSSNGLAKLFE